jgi:beta-lactamase superfamily II metal-dependent hydrolase
MFKIEMLPAGHGDSLLISYGEAGSPHYILIDGGPYYFFADKSKKKLGKRQSLSRRLNELIADSAKLELMVLTHIDADHIDGLVKWIGNHPGDLAIDDIWFNGRHHLEPGWLGVPAGEFFAKLITAYDLPWNEKFEGEAVVTQPDQLVAKQLDGGMKLTILSPSAKDLEALREEWDDELEKEGLDTDDMQAIFDRLEENKRLRPDQMPTGWLGEEIDVEELADSPFEEDDTAPNGSSIAFLAEFEGKAALFTGDAHPSTLVTGLEQILRKRGLSRLPVDVLKIPHHGSKFNTNRELLDLLECQRYLISTNGSFFRHPDQEAVARVLKYGAKAYSDNSFEKAVIGFNYRTKRVKVWDDPELKLRYGYEAVYPEESGEPLIIDL